MKRLIEIMAHQKLFGDLLTVTIIAIGLYSFFTIRREVFQNVSFDVVSVATLFPGASPAEVERLITNPLEQELKEMDGIKKMTSTSVEGRSVILIQLDPNVTDEEKAKSDVRDIVDSYIASLPEGAERPTIKAHETKQAPLIEVSLSSTLPDMELRTLAKRLEKEFELIPGVASVKPLGLRDLEVQVEANPAKLARYQLSLDDLVTALKKRNISVPGGTIEATPDSQFKEKLVRTSGQFLIPQDVGSTVVRANELGQAVRLSDVASINYGLEKPKIFTRTDGVASIRLTVLKKEKADAIDMVDALRKRLDIIRPTIDKRVTLTLVNDASEFVRRRLGILFGNFSLGLGLVLVFLPMFLPLRFALLIALGEPFAFLGTIIAFQLGDFALNMISVLGLIIVSGILVDDGIVVVENIARLIKQGMSPKEAAVKGAQQVWVPILASSATTMIAFIPLAVMSGIFGKFVRYIPLGVIIPICISLFENFFIMPHHIGTWLRPQDFDLKSTGILGFFRRKTDAWWEGWVMPRYLAALKVLFKWRYAAAFGLLVVVGLTVLLATKVMKIILFPPDGVEIFIVKAETPVGTSLEYTSEVMKSVETHIQALDPSELRNSLTTIGIQQQDPHDPNTRRGSEYGQIIVYLTPETSRTRTAVEIINDLRTKVAMPEGLKELVFERVRTGPPTGSPVSIAIRGENYESIQQALEPLKQIARETSGVTDIHDNYTLGKEQLDIRVNQAEASAAGLSVGGIGTAIRAAYEGIVPTSIRTLEEEVKIRIHLAKAERSTDKTLGQLAISNSAGQLIPLTSVATWSPSQELAVRQHEANSREVHVSAEVDTDLTSALAANAAIRKRIPEIQSRFPDLSFHFGGESADTNESLASLGRAFALAIIGIFLILVLTFRALLQPLVILITIPLGLISVVVTFYLHGMPLSFLGMIGMVGLSGIIVNNAIVFVEFVNQSRREGFDRFESILQAATYRARAIFLTTVTTVLGVMPTAYGIGGLDKFVVPIAMAMGWGLTVGSLLALFVLPAFLCILDDFSLAGSRVWRRVIANDK